MRVVIATTTLNAADVIGEFLAHHSQLGVRAVLVMDLGSSDGTLEILASERWKSLVELIPSRGLAENDPSNVTLDVARQRYPDHWCLFCDPDEFVSPEITQWRPQAGEAVLLLKRYNVTGLREDLGEDGAPWGALRFEIARPVERSPAERTSAELTPPWIFSRVGDKVLVKLDAVRKIGPGDHSAEAENSQALTASGLTIRHYPIRTFTAFERKVMTIEEFFAVNPQFPPDWGWHWRRWVRLRHGGRLREEFDQQFIAAGELDSLMAAGAVRRIAAITPDLVEMPSGPESNGD